MPKRDSAEVTAVVIEHFLDACAIIMVIGMLGVWAIIEATPVPV